MAPSSGGVTQIPGYYYDEEKKKYFKIQPNHTVPQGFVHAAENIQEKENLKRKRDQHLKKAAELKQRQVIPPIQRSRVLSSNFDGWALIREVGGKRDSDCREGIVSSVVNRFKPQPDHGIIDFGNHQNCQNMSANNLTAATEVEKFHWDQSRKLLYSTVASHCACIGPTSLLSSTLLDANDPFAPLSKATYVPIAPELQHRFGNWNRLQAWVKVESMARLKKDHLEDQLSCLDVTPQGYAVAIVRNLIFPEQRCHILRNNVSHETENGRTAQDELDLREHSNQGPYICGDGTVWCVAANPFASHGGSQACEAIAVGSENGLEINLISNVGYTQNPPIKTHSDVLSTTWLSHNTVAAGLRNAGILLHDTRAQGSVMRLRHAGSVVRLQRADSEMRLVASGIPSCLSLYDLRMVPLSMTVGPARFAEARHPRAGSSNRISPELRRLVSEVSMPLLKFDHSNKYHQILGFDVDANLGLIAAAQDDRKIKIYSLKSGATIETLSISDKSPEFVKCVQFVDDGRGRPRLLASQGSRIFSLE